MVVAECAPYNWARTANNYEVATLTHRATEVETATESVPTVTWSFGRVGSTMD